MKTAGVLFLALSGTLSLAAVSECGNKCVANMLSQRLGCDSPNLSFGLRDCTTEACPGENVEEVVRAGINSCNANQNTGTNTGTATGTETGTRTGAGSPTTTGTGSGTGSPTTPGTGSPTTTGTGSSTTTGTSGDDGDDDGTSSPYTTIPPSVIVVSSGTGEVTTTQPGTTLYTQVTGTEDSGSATNTITGTQTGTTSSVGSESESESPTGSETESSTDGASTTTSAGLAPPARANGVAAGVVGILAWLAL
ncbi:hypothetical protein FQN57_006319 [Myotisia sp. PD_48]|nr:hypothetical protein FQN57_006319 [Myotisia sp. PD_48]